VSQEHPSASDHPSLLPLETEPALAYPWTAPPPRPKFQHRYGRHLALFAATFLTTTYAQSFLAFFIALGQGVFIPGVFGWQFFVGGLWYSVPLLTILAAHEFGHYLACRHYNVDATLPYFLPMPLVLTGTLGAVIRIREAFPSKQALFDIAVAGPIAGFVVLVPFLVIGVWLSGTAQVTEGSLYFGEPLLFKLLERLRFGDLGPDMDSVLHPMGFAAWFGMLATALNLLPFGQLDGGHIVYSLFRGHRHAVMVSIATLIAAALLTTRSLSWISMLVVMVIMALVLGLRHPQVIDEDTPLDARRRLVALFALAMFLLCFTPVPIQTFIGR
jgi:membrane-associated protease RseP (regulator of RpoE activity)